VDDQTLVREGLVSLLDRVTDLEVVGSAANGADAIDLVVGKSPDVVLMDVRMPGMNGVAATAEIKRHFPDAKIIMLTTFDEDEYVFEALQVGASGYLLKNADIGFLTRAIRAVNAGDSILDPAITGKVVYRSIHGNAIEPVPIERLTSKERQVLALVAEGFSNREIAGNIDVSEGTAKNHVSHILAKLGARDRAHAARLALEWGLLSNG